MGARGPISSKKRIEPRFENKPPEKPEGLSELSSKKWEKVVPMLFKAGVISEGDGDALELMCNAYADYQEYRKVVRQAPFVKNSKGNLIVNPVDRLMRNAQNAYNAYLQAFGMTPHGRMRINAIDRALPIAAIKGVPEKLMDYEKAIDPASFENISDFLNASADREMKHYDGNINTTIQGK
jgi:P27 family predicted phage terminase small subunit